ncbi:MAG: Lrp/AsnC family transcriptional regulator [Phycisphaerae bacterium]
MTPTLPASVPVDIADPTNAAILAVSEDRLQGFQPDPIGAIAEQSGLSAEVVVERVRAMLEAGVIRRVRQTLMATNLAEGALVAWRVPEEKLTAAFDWMHEHDPFTGHVVVRSTDRQTPGSGYRLWTTLKVPQGYDMARHCDHLMSRTGCETFKLLPARMLFVLGVGHVRRQQLEIGSKAPVTAEGRTTENVELSERQWQVLETLKREFAPAELCRDLWRGRAEEAGVPLAEYLEVGRALSAKGVIGRFSTFLEHHKRLSTGERVTKFNALFHWAVPVGMEERAGKEVGRFHCMTHAYWREAGPEFADVNVMGVAHGTEKDRVLAHKAAIDAHLVGIGIPVNYTNVFWGGRSEIKPSEISPIAYRAWCEREGLDPARMMQPA